MSLQVLQRLSDYNKEVKEYFNKDSDFAVNELPLAAYYHVYNKYNKPGLISFDFNHLRDYAIFTYESIKDQNKRI